MATQIKSFGKSRMTIGSCSEFHNNALDLITKTTPAELHIEALEPAYSQAVGQLAGIVNRQRAYISTAQLADTDKVRDNAVGTISSVVIAYQTTPVEDKRQAAMLLDPQLAAYKGIRKHEYSKETAEIKGMLGVLQAEENQAAVSLLGLDAEVTALAEANAAFEAAFLGKAQEKSTRMDVEDLDSEQVVDQANALYDQIVQTVNAYAIVQPTDELLAFINDLNGIVGIYADIVDGTTSGGSTPDGSDPEPTPEPEPGGGNPRPNRNPAEGTRTKAEARCKLIIDN